ncbi:MAG: carboxypeptidase-like regulatory domain-containing protein [Bacteroidota bacterium]|mgnify:CR=1 FL=1|nr:carboxypeptidase-like regulatory domain-containing protein [Bacteroidota bacterium]MDX5404987.1 carboxypeptidase-like regulatory domain-containing protein [Bacteroidota bacterium]MDX5427117.1 carboxypeptidase-like regulatory domain-containing protein [Bacteroidota bacterium]MDX5448112.1 carboxypeptidase-like regulatory domain-containing protein [Bacteroidota bacterium]MDX5505084.1 carboxypeptidase-like regulatory domain-containing protein [Bacteroidota bacterium]
MRLPILFSGIVLFLFMSPVVGEGNQEPRLQGKIIESGSSKTISGATIRVETNNGTHWTGQANERGQFEVPIDWEKMKGQKVWLRIEQKGFAPIRLEITPETRGPINIRMERIAPRLPILVPPGNQPPPGVIIVNQPQASNGNIR